MSTSVLSRHDLLQLKTAFRARYARNTPGYIVSVGFGRDGAHYFLRVLVSTRFRTSTLPRFFGGLPVLARRTSVGRIGV